MNTPNQMNNVINIVRWKPTGEFLGYGRINEEGHTYGRWKYFHKNGRLWQIVDYNEKGERNQKTARYFDEVGNEF